MQLYALLQTFFTCDYLRNVQLKKSGMNLYSVTPDIPVGCITVSHQQGLKFAFCVCVRTFSNNSFDFSDMLESPNVNKRNLAITLTVWTLVRKNITLFCHSNTSLCLLFLTHCSATSERFILFTLLLWSLIVEVRFTLCHFCYAIPINVTNV